MQGIYKIVNNKNDKVYIGSSKNIENRFKQHMTRLKNNNHHSIKLQRFYNKYKDYKIKKLILNYEVVEIVEDKEELKEREQYYIEQYNAYYDGYNCTSKVDNPKYAHKNIIKRQKKSEKEAKKQRYYNLYNEFKNNIFIPFSDYEYNETYLYRVISAIEYFKKNFNTNDYYIEIVQYKSDVTLYIISKTGNIMGLYEYNTKYKRMMIGNKHFYSYMIKNKNVPNERYLKFINIMQCKNRIIGIFNKIIQLDDTITQYNTCKYIKNKYEYRHKIIKELIGYKYNNFNDHVLRDYGVLTYATSNNIKFEHGKIVYKVI